MGFKMQSKKQPPMRIGGPDDYQTPPYAIYPLLPYINKNWIIWESAQGEGNLFREFKKLGYTVFGTDIIEGKDFLSYNPPFHYDFIITNPPYSIKQDFLRRCYELKKPFALLLPLTTFETAKRQELFKKYGLQVLFFDKRINFKTPNGNGSGSWFSTAWFTWGLNLPSDMVFTKLDNNPYQKRLGTTEGE